MGMPIFLLELVIGQYSGQGPNEAFTRLSPLFSGLGYCTLVVISLVTIYYMVIIAWTIFYFFASFSSELGWGKCDNDFNTDGKLFSSSLQSPIPIQGVQLNFTTLQIVTVVWRTRPARRTMVTTGHSTTELVGTFQNCANISITSLGTIHFAIPLLDKFLWRR